MLLIPLGWSPVMVDLGLSKTCWMSLLDLAITAEFSGSSSISMEGMEFSSAALHGVVSNHDQSYHVNQVAIRSSRIRKFVRSR